MAKVYIINGIETLDWEKSLVQFTEEEDGWVATVHCVSKWGNLFSSLSIRNHGKTLKSCMTAFKRGMRRKYGKSDIDLGNLVHEGIQLTSFKCEPCFFCDVDDPSVHESFKAWAAGLFE